MKLLLLIVILLSGCNSKALVEEALVEEALVEEALVEEALIEEKNILLTPGQIIYKFNQEQKAKQEGLINR